MSQDPHNRDPLAGKSERQELRRLLESARAQGRADVYRGKRCWSRYRWGIRLEVALGDPDSGRILQAVMHDISGGGIGFWSKERIKNKTEVLVREWSPQSPGGWVRGVVAHCTVGVAGYRVGLMFDSPLESDASSSESHISTIQNVSPAVGTHSRRVARGSLRTKCMTTSAVACGLGVVLTITIPKHLLSGIPWVLCVALACGVSAGMAGVITWFVLRRYVDYLDGLQAQMRALAQGGWADTPDEPAPCRELNRVQDALTKLQSTWCNQKLREGQTLQKLEDLNLLKTNILNTVSHDLRTPLTSILLYAKMLEEELTTLALDGQRRFLNVIAGECERLSHLVDDLLEAQRLESNQVEWKMRPRDLANTIRNCGLVFQAMAESKSIEFTVECAESLPNVEADSEKIAQVLSNLVSNALKYTQSGGKVRLSAAPNGNELLICVSDNGPGISRDHWAQIFDRFVQISSSYRRQIPGVGLGLHIVRQIVDRHNGRLWVDSEEGQGADFYVALPSAASSKVSKLVEKEPESSGRVLVCDPDPELAERLRQVLHNEGYDVAIAHSGCRLLSMIEQARPEVVVTDILLPDMNAVDLLHALSDKRDHRFALVVHSYAGEGHDLRGKGVDVFLERPARKEDILEAVKLAVRKQKAVEPLALVVGRQEVADRFRTSCNESGNAPLAVPSVKDAVETLCNYPVDIVLVAEDVLDEGWFDLAKLAARLDRSARIIVLCERLGRSQRKRAKAHSVGVVQYVAGEEARILGRIRVSRMGVVEEVGV